MQRIPTITAGLLLGVSFATTAHSDLLDDIRTDATFTVGTEARFAPFEYIEDGEIVGYSADIMEHIMSELEGVGKAFCRGWSESALTTSLRRSPPRPSVWSATT